VWTTSTADLGKSAADDGGADDGGDAAARTNWYRGRWIGAALVSCFSRGRKARCVGGEATGAEEFYVPSLFSTSFFLVVENR
jgi:hypothetical protein